MTTQSLYPLTSSAVSRTLTLAFACVLLAACSGSDGTSSGNAFADPSTLEPGAVPVIDVDVVDPGPIEYEPPVVATPDLYDTLTASGTFTRLLELIDRAGLASVLQEDAALTLFAPTDDAFLALDEAIGQGVVDTFTNQELIDRLRYHTVSGVALESTLLRSYDGLAIQMGNELPAAITVRDDGALLINNGVVSTADVLASNGILHVLDNVLTPPERPGDPNTNIPPPSDEDIAATLLDRPDYSILMLTIETGGLTELLQSDNGGLGWTLFAPSDDDFANSPDADTVFDLDMQGASSLVQRHLYPGRLLAQDLPDGALQMSQGTVEVERTDAGIRVGGALIVGRDRVVSNGIIHYVDAPLISSVP